MCSTVSLCVLCVLHHPLKHTMLPSSPAERLCNVLSKPIYLLHLAPLPHRECTLGVVGLVLSVTAFYCVVIHKIFFFIVSSEEAIDVVFVLPRDHLSNQIDLVWVCGLVLAVVPNAPLFFFCLFQAKHITSCEKAFIKFPIAILSVITGRKTGLIKAALANILILTMDQVTTLNVKVVNRSEPTEPLSCTELFGIFSSLFWLILLIHPHHSH